MKISKSKKIQSCGETKLKEPIESQEVTPDDDLRDELGISCNSHVKAKEHIQQAIDILAATATNGDTVARDALADLSVVFFEL